MSNTITLYPSHQTPAGTPVFTVAARPAWQVNSRIHQLAVLVRDCSSSMDGAKAAEALAACETLVTALAQPVNRNAFHLGVVDFSDTARTTHSVGSAQDLKGSLLPLAVAGCTSLTAGLLAALELLHTPADPVYQWLRPVVLLFSDGGHNSGPAPSEAADRLRREADVVTIGIGADADAALLRLIATSPAHFVACGQREGDLRRFFAAVGATLTQTLARGQNATGQLGRLATSASQG